MAQQPPFPSPDSVARAVVRADSAGDWAGLIRLAHPEALIRFRNLQVFQLRMLGSTEWPGLESMGLDSAAHERWQAQRMQRERFILDSVFQVPDVDSLAHTASDTVLARWLRSALAAMAGDSAAASLAQPPRRVVGAVRASDTLAYVVVERRVLQPLGPIPELFRDLPRESYQADVMVMRRFGREWRSMLEGVGESSGYRIDLERAE